MRTTPLNQSRRRLRSVTKSSCAAPLRPTDKSRHRRAMLRRRIIPSRDHQAEGANGMTQEMRSLYREMARVAIDGTPMTGEKMSVLRGLMMRRDQLAPNVGGEAPDFDLPVL